MAGSMAKGAAQDNSGDDEQQRDPHDGEETGGFGAGCHYVQFGFLRQLYSCPRPAL